MVMAIVRVRVNIRVRVSAGVSVKVRFDVYVRTRLSVKTHNFALPRTDRPGWVRVRTVRVRVRIGMLGLDLL